MNRTAFNNFDKSTEVRIFMKSFADKINELNTQHVYPFHMPGHKRRMELINPYDIDITEIDGYDNLHNPEGMIKQLENRISGMYDEKHEFIEKSYVLVNGSTCGILSAISAVTQYGDRILMARNSHKSAYNAVYIRGLEADYIYPEYIKWLGMNAAIEPDRLRNILTCIKADHGTENENHGKSRCSYKFERKTFKLLIGGSTASNACSMQGYKNGEKSEITGKYKAVYITSPTYEGIVCDIAELSKITHESGIPLIVDEAHGAHFGLADGFPDTAIKHGADIVIQSIHKTLMGMTQTALLHVSSEAVISGRVDIDKLEYFLRLYQTSSPSYVLMASVDECVSVLERRENRNELFKSYMDKIERIHKKSKKWKDIHIFVPELTENVDKKKIYDYDRGKLVIYSESGAMSGREIYDMLGNKYALQLEMSLGRYCLAMTSCMDSDAGFDRLAAALSEIDEYICRNLLKHNYPAEDGKAEVFNIRNKKSGIWTQGQRRIEKKYTIAQAFDMPKVMKAAEAGDISGDYGYVYPPGIPFIVPGAVVTKEILCDIINAKVSGYEVHGVDFKDDVPYMNFVQDCITREHN